MVRIARLRVTLLGGLRRIGSRDPTAAACVEGWEDWIVSGSRYRFLRGGIAGAAIILALGLAPARSVPPAPIPQDGSFDGRRFTGHQARARGLGSFHVPRHPFMARNGRSNIHDDAYMTDAYKSPGPLGRRMRVRSTFQSAECASVAFDRGGRIVTVCVGLEGPKLVLMNARTLETKATFPLPPRSSSGTGTTPFNDFAGGGYFYLDHRDRAVVPTNTREIWVVRHRKANGSFEFQLVRAFRLTGDLNPDEGIVSALPDWRGRIWFVTTKGAVGTVGRHSGSVRIVRLKDEVIANSFAVDESGGVFIVSDRALYRFEANRKGVPKVIWRRLYDRGKRLKPGQVSIGSGTTPTLIGRGFVAITDNADPRMHVLVYRRTAGAGGRLVCSEPVFGRRRGATDNSLIAVRRSLIVENNYGYSGPSATTSGGTTSPGIARVKFSPKGRCRTLWVNSSRAPSVVPKVSLATGLIYTYTKHLRQDDEDPWYFTAISYRSGRTVFKRLAGEGLGFNNNYAPVTLDPRGRALVGTIGGLVQLRDTR
jgi:hypothetical protein